MRIAKTFFRFVGISMIANGIWMISSAQGWFTNIPGDMASTGHANAHLIHDVGIAYIVFGFGLEWCGRNLSKSRQVYLGSMLFLSGHAIGHAIDILSNQLPPSHWWIDFPLVFFPGIVLAILAIPKVWDHII